jgi:hypothetical protein
MPFYQPLERVRQCPTPPEKFATGPEIELDVPTPEVIATLIGFRGVLDISKIGAASLFYFPRNVMGRIRRGTPCAAAKSGFVVMKGPD